MRPTRDAVDDWRRILQIRGVEPLDILVLTDRGRRFVCPDCASEILTEELDRRGLR